MEQEQMALRAAINALQSAGRIDEHDLVDDEHTFVSRTATRQENGDVSLDVYLFVQSPRGNVTATVRVIIPGKSFGKKPRLVETLTIAFNLLEPAKDGFVKTPYELRQVEFAA